MSRRDLLLSKITILLLQAKHLILLKAQLYYYFFSPAVPHGTQYLSSLTRDQAHVPCMEGGALTTGLPWKSPEYNFC